jgi:hypothetical protein
MKKFLVFILLGIAVILTAQTTVSGPVSGDWYDTGNPYNVTGNLSVASGQTLNIFEGVEVYFQGDYTFIINGTLNAIGTANSTLLFTIGGTATEFGGIRFDSADSGTLSYATVEYGDADAANNHGGGIYINGCSPTISHNEIRNCRASYGGGIFVMNSASPTIEWNVIKNNTASSLGGGIGFNGNGASYLAVIRNNLIYDNVNTNSSNGGGGISFYNGTSADIYNNVIFNNSTPNSTRSGGVYAHTSSNIINLWNNVIWGNTRNGGSDPQIYNNSTNTITVTYCDVEGGDGGYGGANYTYEDNIDSNPLFISTTSGSEDFHFQNGSPCINVGDSNSSVPIGGGSCIDIGVYEYISDSQVTENNIDTTIADNEIEGAACAFAAESGTVNVWAQQFLSDPPNTQGDDDIGRYWELEASGNAYIRLFFNSEEVATISSPKIFQYISSSWTELTSSAVGTQGTSSYLDSSNPISNWGSRATSLFTIGEEDSPLPVTLSSFTAIYANSTPILHWTTQSENSNLGWNVYRSFSQNLEQASQINYELIPGAGTTSEPTDYQFTDEYDVIVSQTYWYWLETVDGGGNTGTYGPATLTIPEEEPVPQLPQYTFLCKNYPNPFNPDTKIEFDIKEGENGSLTIYNLKGQLLVTYQYEAGEHELAWDAAQYGSGIYFYKLETQSYTETKKMIMLK